MFTKLMMHLVLNNINIINKLKKQYTFDISIVINT